MSCIPSQTGRGRIGYARMSETAVLGMTTDEAVVSIVGGMIGAVIWRVGGYLLRRRRGES